VGNLSFRKNSKLSHKAFADFNRQLTMRMYEESFSAAAAGGENERRLPSELSLFGRASPLDGSEWSEPRVGEIAETL